jgi:hypothetical protein
MQDNFDWVGVNPPFSRSSVQPGQVVEPGGWLRLLTGEAYAAATPVREREAHLRAQCLLLLLLVVSGLDGKSYRSW